MNIILNILSDIFVRGKLFKGTDISCGPVWMEYIAFLKSMPVG